MLYALNACKKDKNKIKPNPKNNNNKDNKNKNKQHLPNITNVQKHVKKKHNKEL